MVVFAAELQVKSLFTEKFLYVVGRVMYISSYHIFIRSSGNKRDQKQHVMAHIATEDMYNLVWTYISLFLQGVVVCGICTCKMQVITSCKNLLCVTSVLL